MCEALNPLQFLALQRGTQQPLGFGKGGTNGESVGAWQQQAFWKEAGLPDPDPGHGETNRPTC